MVTRLPLALRQAAPDELGVILDLLSESVRWLQDKDTDQWATPWPDETGRNQRIARDLADGKTWLVLNDREVAGTITLDPADDGVWPAYTHQEKAVYVRKVIVRRSYAGLGALLFDWAADVAARVHGARWIRIDVWTTNRRLHAYYQRLGFQFRDLAEDPDYPSRALFERSTSRLRRDYQAVFRPIEPLASYPSH